MGEGPDDGRDGGDGEGPDSVPEWLARAAHASLAPAGAVLVPGTRLSEGRFTLRSVLGRGGMGVVYEADDAERGERVALKTLPESRPAAIYRIKQEFRSLAGVSHENLVQLHGLFEDGGRWFFTMQRVYGRPLLEALGAEPTVAELRQAFAQLAAGVEAIHEAGKLHRDLKPSNVLCTREGRIRILDFGLASDPEAGGAGQTVLDGGVSGTPAYMAPEQAAGRQSTRATDWYAFGVALYEALSGGRLPFAGRDGEVIAHKQTRDPDPPSSEGAPLDAALETLCMGLLCRDPAARPGIEAVRAVLGTPAAPAPAPAERTVFVGRERELDALRAALAVTDEGAPVRMLVSGVSGVGKSALIERFLSELAAYGEALVLSGRCYEHESVPFKAFDAVVDGLSRHLRQLPEGEALALLPAQVHALSALFPAIARLEVLSRVRRRGALPEDPLALRRLGFKALKELCARITLSRPLVLYVDDLQWGDADSAKLVSELLAPPDAPPLLFLGTCRSEEREQSAFLQALAAMDEADPLLERRELSLERLDDRDARALAVQLGVPSGDIDAVAREASGHPLFVQALASHPAASRGVTLEAVLRERVNALEAEPLSLLRVLALSARPLPRALALEAAGLGAGGHAVLEVLTEQSLARVVAGADGARIACYHDRIREVTAAAVPEAVARGVHASLAALFEARGFGDQEARIEHLLRAGAGRRAAALAAVAADHAAAALAFGLAVRLYGVALEQGGELTPDARRALLLSRAEANERELHPGAAADDYEAAADCAEGPLADVLRVRAAAHRLRATSDDADEAALVRSAANIGVRVNAPGGGSVDALRAFGIEAKGPVDNVTFVNLLTGGIAARVREVIETLQPEDRLDLLQRQRLEAMGDAFAVTGHPAGKLSLLAPQILEAIASRSRRHIVEALSELCTMTQVLRSTEGTDALLALLARLTEGGPGDLAHGWVAVARGHRAMVAGHARDGLAAYLEALAHWEQAGSTRELMQLQGSVLTACQLSGNHRELRRAIEWRRDALERGDTARAYQLVARIAQHLIAADEPEAARRYLDPILEAGVSPVAGAMHFAFCLCIAYACDQYEGALHRAQQRESKHRLSRDDASNIFSPFLRNTDIVLVARRVSAGELPAQALEGLDEELARAEESALQLQYARPYVELARAELALTRGDRARAMAVLEPMANDADPQFEVQCYLAARRRYGELLGGPVGGALVEQANRTFLELGIANPDRYTAMLIGEVGDLAGAPAGPSA